VTATTLPRSAFSAITRESNDGTVVLMNLSGESLGPADVRDRFREHSLNYCYAGLRAAPSPLR
jgi:hypothetical protein